MSMAQLFSGILIAAGLCTTLLAEVDAGGLDAFKIIYTQSTGLGPAYNASSCAECHNSPIMGGSSRITVARAGHRDSLGRFVCVPNGGVLHTHFTDPKYTEQREVESIQEARVAINLLGGGYIEAIEDRDIIGVAKNQSKLTNGRLAGQVVYASILEAPGKTAIGRFG
jgi:hypothetical protein